MSEPITVTYSLEAILTRLESKIDRLDEKVDTLTVDVATLKTQMSSVVKDVAENKAAIKALESNVSNPVGFKSLVVPVLIAVVTAALTTLGRFIPSP